MPTIGDKWKQAREAAGLSAAEAGRLANLHRNTIYDLEKEKDGVSLRVMKQVAAIYGVDLGEIFTARENVERLPIEFRPLAEIISPLTLDARVSIVKNIVSNLRFMTQLVTVADEGRMEKQETSGGVATYTVRPSSKFNDKPPADVAERLASGSSNDAARRHGNAQKESPSPDIPHEYVPADSGVERPVQVRQAVGRSGSRKANRGAK